MGTGDLLALVSLVSRKKMAFAYFLVAFLAITAVKAEEHEYVEGLSAEEIMNTEFETEYSAEMEDMTIDEIIAAAGTKQGAALAAGENQQINYDMDMNMDPIQYEVEYGNMAGYAGAGMASSYYRWPKGIIPYKIRSGYSSSAMNTIYQGMRMWMQKTCIKFVPYGSAEARAAGHNHYIEIFSGGGCYSSVGYNHRSHQVSLASLGCVYPGIVAHELGHTIGRSHVSGAGLTYTDATIVNKMYGCSNVVGQTSCPKVPCTSKWSSRICNSLRGRG